jgi:hypothetical protein
MSEGWNTLVTEVRKTLSFDRNYRRHSFKKSYFMKIKIEKFSLDTGSIHTKWWHWAIAALVAIAAVFRNEVIEIFKYL